MDSKDYGYVTTTMKTYNAYKLRLKRRLTNQKYVGRKRAHDRAKLSGANTPRSKTEYNEKALDELFKDTVCNIEKPHVCKLIKRRVDKTKEN